ncbi:hypothetical protein A1354_00305 [Pseudomonas asplenii]|nr:hypothetical protein A1354_00305 [Pseudomonas asplenii]
MTCLICMSEDKSVGFGGTWVERVCSKCGRYGIQSALIEQMEKLGQRFHIGRTRDYLVMRIEHGENPWITPVDINNYCLLDS